MARYFEDQYQARKTKNPKSADANVASAKARYYMAVRLAKANGFVVKNDYKDYR
jgi:hypothetical protein